MKEAEGERMSKTRVLVDGLHLPEGPPMGALRARKGFEPERRSQASDRSAPLQGSSVLAITPRPVDGRATDEGEAGPGGLSHGRSSAWMSMASRFGSAKPDMPLGQKVTSRSPLAIGRGDLATTAQDEERRASRIRRTLCGGAAHSPLEHRIRAGSGLRERDREVPASSLNEAFDPCGRGGTRAPDSIRPTVDLGTAARSANSAWVRPDRRRPSRTMAAIGMVSTVASWLPIVASARAVPQRPPSARSGSSDIFVNAHRYLRPELHPHEEPTWRRMQSV
jgi:hypothetical protein